MSIIEQIDHMFLEVFALRSSCKVALQFKWLINCIFNRSITFIILPEPAPLKP